MILACHGIQKSFGEHLIVRDGSFHIEDHEKQLLSDRTVPVSLLCSK